MNLAIAHNIPGALGDHYAMVGKSGIARTATDHRAMPPLTIIRRNDGAGPDLERGDNREVMGNAIGQSGIGVCHRAPSWNQQRIIDHADNIWWMPKEDRSQPL